MILRAAPCDVSRTRHALGPAGTPGARLVPAFVGTPVGRAVPSVARRGARDRAALVSVLD